MSGLDSKSPVANYVSSSLTVVVYMIRWSTDYLADLYLYGASNGIILDMAVNRSEDMSILNNLYVVGDFDSVSELSQIQYCSVGEWDGLNFNKVGALNLTCNLK